MTLDLRALVARLNTTHIGNVGVGTAVSSAAVLLFQGSLRHGVATAIAPHLGTDAATVANLAINNAVQGASAVLLPAIAAAFVGQPPLPKSAP